MKLADHMMAMKMINEAHIRKGKVKSFTSYCGGLPSPAAANNPLAYKFRYLVFHAINNNKLSSVFHIKISFHDHTYLMTSLYFQLESCWSH